MYINRLIGRFRFFSSPEEKKLARSIHVITGQYPGRIELYHLALKQSSTSSTNAYGIKESNERLEYLGDAVLGMIVANYLFTQFPFKEEGFLTEIRSKIVSRESLNLLARKMGINELIKLDQKSTWAMPKSIYGDALEALIGALFRDKGFIKCQEFIINKIILAHCDLNELVHTVINHKSKLIEWAQKENKLVSFQILDDKQLSPKKQFIIQVVIDEKNYEMGYGLSKKKAEQDAARRTLDILNKTNNE